MLAPPGNTGRLVASSVFYQRRIGRKCVCVVKEFLFLFLRFFIYCAALWSVVLFYEKQWLRYGTVRYSMVWNRLVRYGMDFCSVFKKCFFLEKKKTFTSDPCDL